MFYQPMFMVLLTLWLQAASPEIGNAVGWSVYAPTPLGSDSDRAEICLRRHSGSRRISADMQCRIDAGGQLTGCEMVDGRYMSRRDLDTLRCIARTQSAPRGDSLAETIVVTITVKAP